MGLMQASQFRLVTPKSRLAMPEITIGLFPDVGASWFLNRLPGKTGLFLGLTGVHLNARDALDLGLADRFVDAWRASLEAGYRLLRLRPAHGERVPSELIERVDALTREFGARWIASGSACPRARSAPWSRTWRPSRLRGRRLVPSSRRRGTAARTRRRSTG